MICYYNNNFQRITIIEIKDYDTLKLYNFLELDENAMNPKKFGNYLGIIAYMVKYCNNKGNFKYDISFGSIELLDEGRAKFVHQIDSGNGSLGSPILNLNTFKVFGVHDSVYTGYRFRFRKYGYFLYWAVTEFQGKFISIKK